MAYGETAIAKPPTAKAPMGMARQIEPDPWRMQKNMRAEDCKKRGDALYLTQQMHKFLWQTLAEIFYPERADFVYQRVTGTDQYDGLYSSEPQLLRRAMANRVGSMTRQKGTKWFRLAAFPEKLMKIGAVKKWCDEATTRQRNVIYSSTSGFARAMAESDNDFVCFGNSVVRHAYNSNRDGIYFACAHLRDCAWAENAEGRVNEMHERMQNLTIAQAVSMFGLKNLPRVWQHKFESEPHTKVQIERCVYPVNRDAYEAGEKPRKGAQFASCYFAMGQDSEGDRSIAEEFFDIFPYTVRRWMTVSGEVYARSPCSAVALADGRVLNIAEQALLKAVEWSVDPPKTAPDDGVMGEVRLETGGITYIDRAFYDMAGGKPPIQNIQGGESKHAMDYIERKSAMMARAFFMDLLRMPDREMTATEYSSRMKIILRDAAPVFEPIESDYSLLMEGVFNRILNAHGPSDPWGGFDEAPDELSGAEVRFEFQTALTEAFTDQKRQDYLQVQAQYEVLKQLQAEGIDYINMDAAVKSSLENFDPEWTMEDDAVMAARQQRAQQMQQEKAAAQAQQIAETAAKTNPEQYRQIKGDMQDMANQNTQAAGA